MKKGVSKYTQSKHVRKLLSFPDQCQHCWRIPAEKAVGGGAIRKTHKPQVSERPQVEKCRPGAIRPFVFRRCSASVADLKHYAVCIC